MTDIDIEKKAYEAVKAFEKNAGRASSVVKKDGYDIRSKNGDEERHIEVKGTRQKTLDWRWLEEKEYRALMEDPKFYLYAVCNISDDPGINPEVTVFTKEQMQSRFYKIETKYIFKFKRTDFDGGSVDVKLY